jgi:UDP-GlcNAc:undecaprenyl-phosphate GlcNAc-1-phosphate transferase
MNTIIALGLAMLLTLGLTPFVRRLAIYLKAMDAPEQRKVHKVPMPRMGGLAIFASFWLTIFLTQPMTRDRYGFFFGSCLIVISGIWDDIKGVKPVVKILFQLAAAAVVIMGGTRVSFITSLWGQSPLVLGHFSIPITVLWIIGMTNAINLVDGLDGLAAGVSGIAAITIGIISWMEGMVSVGLLSLILGAATLAFLKYNFHPAKIFMGDTGALFLGYALSVLSIMGLTKMATTVSLFLPIVVLGVPIMDTLFAIIRRFLKKQPIFAADKDHLHHRLLAMGLSHKNAVLVVYGVSTFLSLSAIGMAMVSTEQAMVVMVLVAVAVFYGADRIGIIGNKAKSVLGSNYQKPHSVGK